MRRSASEIINNLQMRIARLEKQAIFGLFEKTPLDTVHGWFLKGLKDNRAVNSDVKMDKDNRLSGKFKFEGEVYQVSLKREGKDTAEYKITGGNRDFRQVDFELSGANDSKMSERNFIKRVVDQVIYRVGQESARKEVEEHQKMVNQERDRLRKQGRIARLEKQARHEAPTALIDLGRRGRDHLNSQIFEWLGSYGDKQYVAVDVEDQVEYFTDSQRGQPWNYIRVQCEFEYIENGVEREDDITFFIELSGPNENENEIWNSIIHTDSSDIEEGH
jgi:hypothetical protein